MLDSFGRRAQEINLKKNERSKGDKIFADFADSSNDNDDIQLSTKLGKFFASRDGGGREIGRSTYKLTYRLDSRIDSKKEPTEKIENTFMNKYAVCPVLPSDKEGSSNPGKDYTMTWEEFIPFAGEYTFKAICDRSALVTIRPNDGDIIDIFNGDGSGRAKKISRIKNNSVSNGDIEIRENKVDLNVGTYTIEVILSNDFKNLQRGREVVFATGFNEGFRDKAERRLWKVNPTLKSNFFDRQGVLPFDPIFRFKKDENT